MADISGVTAVRPHTNTASQKVTLGADVGLLKAVYKDTTTNTYKLCNPATAAASIIAGLTMTTGVNGGECQIVTSGSVLVIGPTLPQSETYVLSANAGELKPIDEKILNEFITHVGIAANSNQLDLIFNSSEILYTS